MTPDREIFALSTPGACKLQRGQPNELLVLGTPHLSQLPKAFDPANLSGLMDRLAHWQPQAIAIEAISGLHCAAMWTYPERYLDEIKSLLGSRAGMSARPGIRVLVIVGASHKGYLDAYLNQMHDLRAVDTNKILR